MRPDHEYRRYCPSYQCEHHTCRANTRGLCWFDDQPIKPMINEGDRLTFGTDPMVWIAIKIETVNGMPAYRIVPDTQANNARYKRLKATVRAAKPSRARLAG